MRKKCCASSPASQTHFYKRNVDFTEKIRTPNKPYKPLLQQEFLPEYGQNSCLKAEGEICRGGEIRTPDLVVPNDAR